MKKLIYIILIFFFSAETASVSSQSGDQVQLSDCVKKYRSEWGRSCSACKQEGNTYTIFLKNECAQTVDVKCAVQEAEKRWRTFTRLNLLPKDTISAYACNGSGKYLYWVRKSGDKTIVFPADEEIDKTYAK